MRCFSLEYLDWCKKYKHAKTIKQTYNTAKNISSTKKTIPQSRWSFAQISITYLFIITYNLGSSVPRKKVFTSSPSTQALVPDAGRQFFKLEIQPSEATDYCFFLLPRLNFPSVLGQQSYRVLHFHYNKNSPISQLTNFFVDVWLFTIGLEFLPGAIFYRLLV